MNYQITVTKGIAVIVGDGLRCAAPRRNEPTKACNKLIVKLSPRGRLEVDACCERCHQQIVCVTNPIPESREDLEKRDAKAT